MTGPPNDCVLYDAVKLQTLLAEGKLTSVNLAKLFLDQVGRHNRSGKNVNAVISTAPRDLILARAEELDTERREGKFRGPLHGIPIIVKDAVVTGPELGMPTTVGSWAFSTLKSRKNAPIIDKLIAAGGIILAKTNLTEFCGLKSSDTDVGWSAFGGQTNSPWRRDDLKENDQPMAGGSSSGSAVGIVTGFAPLSIGTETAGSTIYPASLNGLYGMKLGRGSASNDGVFGLSREFDGVGVMARTPHDLANLAEAIMTSTALARFPQALHRFSEETADAKMNVGIVPVGWGMPESSVEMKWGLPAVRSRYEAIAGRLGDEGHRAVFPLKVAEADSLTNGDINLVKVAYYEFPSLVKQFLTNFDDEAGIKSLEDIIAWNQENAEKAMPPPRNGQTELIAALESKLTPESSAETVAVLQRLADEDGMGKVMDDQHLDVVVAPSDSTLVSFAACAGWPIATCPLGNLEKNGQPFGVFVTARSEDTLFRFMGNWFRIMPKSQGPEVSTG